MENGLTKCCRPMLSEGRRKVLGSMYSLVGTHSAVKLCRWQKSMMRGRGGCYKWTMYGVASHRCMEATPSMACANNCVFCWRHNTNPTATEWRWQVDSPTDVLNGMLSSHRALVYEVQGMPSVTAESLAEALDPCHCALSLVGEPILYPFVNKFLKLLHQRKISSFLVNNGQFPDALAALSHVTQLYMSIDSPNKQTMKILDRPIFPDYWERFNKSVDIMRHRSERTVFRMTLIDGFNMSDDDANLYADLIYRGQPDFVELKRLTPTFYGKAHTALRISNVPSWNKVKAFAYRLCEITTPIHPYFIASVHEHSGCVLLAHEKFCIDGRVHTWIDFDKFHAMLNCSAQLQSLSPHSYLLPTPEWALADSADEGFDPNQKRHMTSKRLKYLACASISEELNSCTQLA